MKTRISQWFDRKRWIPQYGLEVYSKKLKRWINVAEDGRPFIKDTVEELEPKRKILRKIKD